jgi:hypothetical protein
MAKNGMSYGMYADWLASLLGVSCRSHLEQPQHKRYAVYFMRNHLKDFENPKKISRGHLKIGKSECIANMLRRRDQGGSKHHIYGEILLSNSSDMDIVENLSKKIFLNNKIHVNDTSDEIYNFTDVQIPKIIQTLCNATHTNTSVVVNNSYLYMNLIVPNLTVVAPKPSTYDSLFTFDDNEEDAA